MTKSHLIPAQRDETEVEFFEHQKEIHEDKSEI